MQLNTHLHLLYVVERQQRLLAEAAAYRLVERDPLRTRIARLFRRATNRLETPAVGRRPRDTAAGPADPSLT
jgi:hypothetical protein